MNYYDIPSETALDMCAEKRADGIRWYYDELRKLNDLRDRGWFARWFHGWKDKCESLENGNRYLKYTIGRIEKAANEATNCHLSEEAVNWLKLRCVS